MSIKNTNYFPDCQMSRKTLINVKQNRSHVRTIISLYYTLHKKLFQNSCLVSEVIKIKRNMQAVTEAMSQHLESFFLVYTKLLSKWRNVRKNYKRVRHIKMATPEGHNDKFQMTFQDTPSVMQSLFTTLDQLFSQVSI